MDEERNWLEFARHYGPARPLSAGEAHEISAMLDAYRVAKGPLKSVAGDWLVRAAMRLKGWRSPLSWFRRTNVKGLWTIVSYHHRARLCWSWIVTLSVGKQARSHWWRWFGHGHGGLWFGIPWVAQVRYQRQPYDWMLSSDAENLLRALCEHHHQQRLAA